MRPDIVAGPIDRKCSLSNSCATEVAATGVAVVASCARAVTGAHRSVSAASEAVRPCSVLNMEGVFVRRGTDT